MRLLRRSDRSACGALLALTVLLALHVCGPAAAQPTAAAPAVAIYDIDPKHSEISFRIRHLVTKVRGRFDEYAGSIRVAAGDPSESSVVLTIQTASVDTFLDDRDQHLRSKDFFAVADYPTISFESTRIAKTGESTFAVTGRFTMRGVTKEITLPVTFLGEIQGPDGELRAGFEAATVVDRNDYGIDWNAALDRGGLLLGKDVEISISLEAIRRPDV